MRTVHAIDRRSCSVSPTASPVPTSSRSGSPTALRVAADDDRDDTERHHVASDRHGRHRPRVVGRQPRLPRLPLRGRTADDPDNTDELRLDLDPSPGVTYADGAGGRHRGAALPRRPRHHLVHQDHGQPRAARLRPGRAGMGLVRHERQAAIAVARAPRCGAASICSPTSGGRRSAARGCSSTSTRTRPHKTVFGAWCVRAARGAGVDAVRDELDSIHPDALIVRTVPERLAGDGDPWADIDAVPQSIAVLVERYERDLANGIPDAPWPPVYPKMPDEARRVNPSRLRHDTD